MIASKYKLCSPREAKAACNGGFVTGALITLLGAATLLLACGGGNNQGSNQGSGSGAGNNVTVSISANPTTVDLGQSTTLTWSSTNAASCVATSAPPESDWTAVVATSGTTKVTPPTLTNELYSLTCTATSGNFATGSVTVTVNSAAAGIVNGTSVEYCDGSGGRPGPGTIWSANGCVFDGNTINNLTLISGGVCGPMIGVCISPLGCSPQGYGGVFGTWATTTDGTGLLATYQNGGSCGSIKLPASILNINGSTASGSFSADLVDESGGAQTPCTFSLISAPNEFQTISCPADPADTRGDLKSLLDPPIFKKVK